MLVHRQMKKKAANCVHFAKDYSNVKIKNHQVLWRKNNEYQFQNGMNWFNPLSFPRYSKTLSLLGAPCQNLPFFKISLNILKTNVGYWYCQLCLSHIHTHAHTEVRPCVYTQMSTINWALKWGGDRSQANVRLGRKSLYLCADV